MRLLWLFTTPRRLRRNALIVLLIWLGIAMAHQHGVFDDTRWQVPTSAVPAAPLLAPHTPSGG